MGILSWLLDGSDDDDNNGNDKGFWGPPDPLGDRETNDTEFLADLFGNEDDA